jgi:hypothetical protein
MSSICRLCLVAHRVVYYRSTVHITVNMRPKAHSTAWQREWVFLLLLPRLYHLWGLLLSGKTQVHEQSARHMPCKKWRRARHLHGTCRAGRAGSVCIVPHQLAPVGRNDACPQRRGNHPPVAPVCAEDVAAPAEHAQVAVGIAAPLAADDVVDVCPSRPCRCGATPGESWRYNSAGAKKNPG